MAERPLHVLVAEALGWFDFQPSLNGLWPEEMLGHPPRPIIGEKHKLVPRYDMDWAAIGPVIWQHRIRLAPLPPSGEEWEAERPADFPANDWQARGWVGRGRSPQMAVCHLILALHAAGKLKAAA